MLRNRCALTSCSCSKTSSQYGDPAILFQTNNRQSLTKIWLQVRLPKNDLKNWLNGNFGLNLQLPKLRLRLQRVISSFRLLYLLCFHEASLKVAKNRLGSADHRDWRSRYVCHAFTIPKNYHAILFICVQGMNARPMFFRGCMRHKSYRARTKLYWP